MLPLSTVLVLRAGRGYLAFPSAEDLIAVPTGWAATDPSLFPGDSIVRTLGHQVPLWGWVVRLADGAGEFSNAFWWLTIVLSLAAAMGAFGLMRALRVRGLLIPPALLVGFFGPAGSQLAQGYQTRFATAFQVEWLALTLLLWSYGAFARGRAVVTGGLLGLAALIHPVAALQGGLVLLIATPLTAGAPWQRLAIILLVAAMISVPIVLGDGLGGFGSEPWLKEVYFYRLPERYELEQLSYPAALVLAIQLFAGLTGAALLARGERSGPARAIAGLLLGHATLAVAAMICYGLELPQPLRHSAVPYILDLTLTMPLLPVLAAVAALAPLDARVNSPVDFERESLIPWLALGVALVSLLAFTGPAIQNVVVVALTFGALATIKLGRGRQVVADALAVFGVFLAGSGALIWAATHEIRARPGPDSDDLELYAWARRARPASALFIVPPSALGFRFYTRRGVYADYGLFPATSPEAVREWRRRLEQVAAPERRTFGSPPWKRPFMWERDYANRNPPTRIAQLLDETRADYFVWDARGLDIPPFLTVTRSPDAKLIEVFRNRRYIAYARAGTNDAVR